MATLTEISGLRPPLDLDVTYRPQRLADLVGQPTVASVLGAQLEAGALSSAFLFSGPHGVGKTTSARILALAANCQQRSGIDPCGECSSCRRILRGEHEFVTEINSGADGGVDNIRSLTTSLSQLVPDDGWRVVILDEAHGLTQQAVAALLKPLEEPPARTSIVLCTTSPAALAPTLRSRCVQLQFNRIDDAELVSRCQAVAEAAGLELDEASADRIAQRSNGCLREALELVGVLGQGADNWLSQVGLAQEHAGQILLAMANNDLAGGMTAVRGLLVAVGHDTTAAFKEISEALFALHMAVQLQQAPADHRLNEEAAELIERAGRRTTIVQAQHWLDLLMAAWDRSKAVLLSNDVLFGLLLIQSMAAPTKAAAAPQASAPAVAAPVAAGGPFEWSAAVAATSGSIKTTLSKASFVAFDEGHLILSCKSALAAASINDRKAEITAALAGFGVQSLVVK